MYSLLLPCRKFRTKSDPGQHTEKQKQKQQQPQNTQNASGIEVLCALCLAPFERMPESQIRSKTAQNKNKTEIKKKSRIQTTPIKFYIRKSFQFSRTMRGFEVAASGALIDQRFFVQKQVVACRHAPLTSRLAAEAQSARRVRSRGGPSCSGLYLSDLVTTGIIHTIVIISTMIVATFVLGGNRREGGGGGGGGREKGCLFAPSMSLSSPQLLPLTLPLASAQYLSAVDYSYQPSITYNGQARSPDSWASITVGISDPTPLFPKCSNVAGQQQSPIAITSFTIDSQLQPLVSVSDAYPTLTGVTTCQWWSNGADLRLIDFDYAGLLIDPEEPTVEKKLEYISFHIGAAHAIGGTHADLEVSFAFTPTVGSGKLTIVSVVATSGSYSSHKLLGELLAELPVSWGTTGTIPPSSTPLTKRIPYLKGKFIDYRNFLPGRRAYFVYEGSEMSPPCRPARVYVMETPIHLSHRQLALLRNRTGALMVPPRADRASELVGTARPTQPIADTKSFSGVRKYEEIFIPTVYDNLPPAYTGKGNIVAMSICAVVLGVISFGVAGYVIYKNWLEVLKLPTNYGIGVDRSLIETIQGDVAAQNPSAAAGGGPRGSKSSSIGREKGGGGRKSAGDGAEKKYLKGLPAAAKAKTPVAEQKNNAFELYN